MIIIIGHTSQGVWPIKKKGVCYEDKEWNKNCLLGYDVSFWSI